MRTYPRIRKTIIWGGAAVTVLLMAAWLASVWSYARFTTRTGHMVSSGEGRIVVFVNRLSYSIFDETGWHAGASRFPCRWGMPECAVDKNAVMLAVPFWIPTSLLFILTAAAWRLDVLARPPDRAHAHLCPKCHYDRAGIGSDVVCPECGTAARPGRA